MRMRTYAYARVYVKPYVYMVYFYISPIQTQLTRLTSNISDW